MSEPNIRTFYLALFLQHLGINNYPVQHPRYSASWRSARSSDVSRHGWLSRGGMVSVGKGRMRGVNLAPSLLAP